MASTPAASIRSEKSDALFQVKLLAALRSGDPAELHPYIAEIGRLASKSEEQNNNLGASTLHLAVRCASYDTVALLLSQRSISPNATYPAGSRVTALHLAASLGRADIVRLLLDQEGIDDTVKDDNERTVLDVASKDIKEVIHESRDTFARIYLTLLREYITSPISAPPPSALLAMLNSPRIKLIDLSTLDSGSGTTILHEAARRKDLRLVELLVRAGADVFVRDRKGRAVAEGDRGSGRGDDQVKVFLRQFTNRETTLIDTSASEPPSLKGYLNKYTNVARGYNTRWFVLKDGMLSYYRHQDDENLACRGSISMRTAKLKVNAGDRLRFEISSTTTRSGSPSQKWYMRANHPVEVARWTQAINRSIEWYNRLPDHAVASSAMGPLRNGSNLRGTGGYASDTASVRVGDNSSIYASSWKSPKKPRRRRSNEKPARSGSPNGSFESWGGEESAAEFNPNSTLLDRGETDSVDSSGASGLSEDNTPPHQDKFHLQTNSTQAQIELTSQLLSSASSTGDTEVRSALKASLRSLGTMYGELVAMTKEREAWYEKRYTKEKDKSVMWEDSLRLVVGESEHLEQDLLRLRKEKRGMRKALRASMMVAPDSSPSMGVQVLTNVQSPDQQTQQTQQPHPEQAAVKPQPPVVVVSSPVKEEPSIAVASTSSPVEVAKSPTIFPITASTFLAKDDSREDSGDSEDEFFDAIDSNNLPSLVVPAPLVAPPPHDVIADSLIDIRQYNGYEHPRERLPISKDDRPPISLWAVLKNSIGKDLTKISFPVFFNEPTSMLQRMAEDMEFAECLDAATAETDPHKRIAYVAAFAMSNYSSTIGRIAKPFNPMLGETFEYCRVDRQYRYISEQVSHHPPISACWAESPTWNYYGEVDAKNKFMGKSFEIRPTGVAHADLKIPKSYITPGLASKYPTNPGVINSDYLVEHYSWKKVTTNISGFIVGNPTIDHYGTMTVVNHRTGDTCVLNFKPRGWTVSTACEIKGSVMDSNGRTTWEIAGRWNSQLIARRAGSGHGGLLPDASLSDTPGQPECILLWRNTEKPPSPFNLTPFAITLNDCPTETLKPFLPPTDCRLRPDQRAFENGKYEKANDLKGGNEELQRATRKRREIGELPPHKPRWFEATTEPDTGERVWAPSMVGNQLEYWVERERVWKAGGRASWTNVDKIFVDDE